MVERHAELSVEMRPFISLELARPFIRRFCIQVTAYLLVLTIAFFLLLPVFSSVLFPIVTVVLIVVGTFSIYRNSPLLHVPLAVNINHPFMSDAELGFAVVMVRFSDNTWSDIGEGRVLMAEDELVGGTLLLRDDETYAPIGHFSERSPNNAALKRHVTLINQAIALRDAVNGEEDTIEQARERENIDTGLLERSWFEDEEAIEIEPDGLMGMLRRE